MSHHNAKIHNQTQYYKKIEMRLCTHCIRPAEEERVRCKYHNAYQKQYMIERKIERLARGVCYVCKEPANKTYNGKKVCSKHRRIAREGARERTKLHKALGLCRNCKAAPVKDRTMCEKHLAQLRASGKKRTAKKKAAN